MSRRKKPACGLCDDRRALLPYVEPPGLARGGLWPSAAISALIRGKPRPCPACVVPPDAQRRTPNEPIEAAS